MRKLTVSIFLLLSSVSFSQYVPEWAQSTYVEQLRFSVSLFTTDQNNNIYLASYKEDNVYRYNVVVAKFNSNGAFQWIKEYSPRIYRYDQPVGIHCDNLGNVYVVCETHEDIPSDNTKFFILKFSSSGSLIGEYIHDMQNRYLHIYSTAIDNSANIYLTGHITCEPQSNVYRDSIFTAKINSNCTLVWQKNYKGPMDEGHISKKLKVDASGNVYVTGMQSGINYWWNTVLLKYSPSGTLLWSQAHSFDPNNSEEANDLALDNNQNIYITGFQNFGQGNDSSKVTLLKYNPSGQLQWANTYNNSPINTEQGRKLLIDNNNIYIYCDIPGENKLLKVNQNGQQQWAYTTPLSTKDIYFDNNKNVLISGVQTAYFRSEAALQRINPLGTSDWISGFSYNGSGGDIFYDLKVNSDNSILASGYHNGEILAVKLVTSIPNSLTSIKNNINKSIIDNQYTYDTITFNLPASSYVKNVYITIDTILHPNIGDLDISLIHSGKEDTIIFRRGGLSDNYINTNLGDTSVLQICSIAAPYTGYFKPCKPLSQFMNLNAGGPWILKIRDRAVSNTGTLNAWKLNVQYEYPIGITQISSEVPQKYMLSQNYPNPFNPVTNIRFDIPKHTGRSNTVVKVFDILGRELATLVNELVQPGQYEVTWDASAYPSGVYFYRLVTGEFSESKKMILVK